MQNVFVILIIGILWGVADVLRKYAAKGSSNQLLATIFNLGTLVGPLVLIIFSLIQKQKMKWELQSLSIAFLGGLLAGIGGYLIFFLLSKGIDISNTIPSIRALSITLVALGGVILFSEQLTTQLIFGIIFSIIGIYLLLLA